MSVEISSIKDIMLQQIALNADSNKDKKLSENEYSVFAQNAIKQGASYKQVSEALDMNVFERWWFDVDKVSTDGKDDGHLSLGEKAESFGKGIANIIKAPLKNLPATAVTLGLGALATFATGGAALPLIIGAGAAFGAFEIGKGVYNAATAETDADAKRAFESMGTGTATLALSALGVKSANKVAAKAGVKSLEGLENASWTKNVSAMGKSMPNVLKQSGLNIKGNALTWTSALKGDNVIYSNSNKMRSFESVQLKDIEGNSNGSLYITPEGTKIQTSANGVQTVGAKQVVLMDKNGNPYATSVEGFLKNNSGLSDKTMQRLYELDPAGVAKKAPKWYYSKTEAGRAEGRQNALNFLKEQGIEEFPNKYSPERVASAFKRAQGFGGVEKYVRDVHGRDMHGMETITNREWEDLAIFEDILGYKPYNESAKLFVGSNNVKVGDGRWIDL